MTAVIHAESLSKRWGHITIIVPILLGARSQLLGVGFLQCPESKSVLADSQTEWKIRLLLGKPKRDREDPPNHILRWDGESLNKVLGFHGFDVLSVRDGVASISYTALMQLRIVQALGRVKAVACHPIACLSMPIIGLRGYKDSFSLLFGTQKGLTPPQLSDCFLFGTKAPSFGAHLSVVG